MPEKGLLIGILERGPIAGPDEFKGWALPPYEYGTLMPVGYLYGE